MENDLDPDGFYHHVIDEVAFRFYSSEEIKKLSVKEITNPETFDLLTQAVIGGLYDPALGPTDQQDVCFTCGQGYVHCPGHMGYIELPFPVFNPVFFMKLYRILKSTCFYCHRITADMVSSQLFMNQCRLLEVGNVSAAASLPDICGVADEGEETTKEESISDKIKLIQEFTEKALKDESSESVVLVKNVEAVRQEIVENFIKLKLKISGKCPYCEDPIQTVRQERKTKLIMITRGSKYSAEMQKKASNVNVSDEEDLEDENGEPKAKRPKTNLKQDPKPVSGEVNLLTPLNVREHLRKVWNKDSALLKRIYPVLGFSKYADPVDMFFVEMVVVPASRFRPTSRIGDLVTNHPHSVNLSRVLKTSTLIREILWELEKAAASTTKAMEEKYSMSIITAPGKTLVDKLNLSLERLQTQVNVVTDSDLDKLAKEYYPGIKQILEKKEGLFRKNMMGKRVNYAARSVISPDPNLNTNEIGIPLVFAEKLTFPQPVTPWNVQELRQAIINGPNKYPGAFKIMTEDGKSILLDKRSSENRMAIAKELLTPSSHAKPSSNIKGTKIVYRHLKNGDVLLINRQPTLHRPSIQGHKARVLPGEKTLRLHYANCKAYNADFDGDEMNAHFPQNEVARAEGYHIALTDYQYLVPKDGTPLAGLIQDHMVSGVSLTIRGRFFSKADYCRLVYSALIDKVGKIRLLPPAILKPGRLWSGKQVLSTLVLNVIPEGSVPLSLTGKAKVPEKSWINSDLGRVKPSPIAHMGESDVVIRHGELLVGVLDKGHYGPTPFGLVHSCYELYGGPVAGRLLTCFGRLFMNFLQWRGFSLGVEDILVTDKANKERKEIIKKSKTVGRDVAIKALDLSKTCSDEELLAAQRRAHFQRDQVQMQELDLAMRGQTNDIQNSIVNACMPYGLEKLFPKNNLQLMVVSGAKGSMVNCMQISCLLGQIELEGKRPPLMASGRTLPSFLSYDMTPRAGGFVTGRFLTGIRQQEYFFHCMAGREGLVDTAVKTSRSGYLQRCLIKHLEGLKVNYDLTVRDSDNSIIQFHYGEDSLDISRIAYLNPKQFPFILENHSVVRNHNHPHHSSDKKVRKAMKKIKKWQGKNENFTYEGAGKVRRSGFLKFCQDIGDSIPEERLDFTVPGRNKQAVQLCKMWREMNNKKRQKYMNKNGRCPDPVLSKFSLYSTPVLPEKFSNILDSFVKGNPDIVRKGLTGSGFQDMMERKVKQCVVDPGEAVGLLCAQSIGEPSTQMTLNTFHFAGRGEMNVTLGIPRLREILMVGSKEIKTPAMDIPVLSGPENKNKAKRLQKKFTKVYLSQVLQNIQVTEWMSVIGKNKHTRKRMFKVRFNFLPKTAYKERFIVTPNQILGYMERAYIKRIDTVIRHKLKVMSSSKLLSHGTRVSSNQDDPPKDDEEFKETALKTVTDLNDEDSDADDDDDADKGNSASKKEKKKHEEEHEYEDSEEEDQEYLQNAADEDDVEMDDQEEQYGDIEENLIIDKEHKDDHREARINAVLQLASSVTAYDYDSKKKLWCEVTLAFPIYDSKIDIASVLEADVTKAVVHEVPGLSGCFLGEQKGAGGPELHLKTEGINIYEINNYINILDVNRLYCNSIHAVARTYGIEAANKVIIKEIQMVFGAYGIEVDYRHLSLLADYMTFEGLYKPFSRRSVSTNPSPLQKMSFETTMQFLVQATIEGHKDKLTSPSSEIILGKNLSCGTGSFDLFNPIKI